jgi:hypothetical protein
VAGRSTGPEDINLRFQTPAQNHVVGTNREPASRLLEEVEAAADLHGPAIVNADFSVMQICVEFDLEENILLEQALLKFLQLVANAREIGLVVVA